MRQGKEQGKERPPNTDINTIYLGCHAFNDIDIDAQCYKQTQFDFKGNTLHQQQHYTCNSGSYARMRCAYVRLIFLSIQ